MLSAIHYAVDLIAEHEGVNVDLAQLDLADDEVYTMLRKADAVGVFQVESRAQLATLARLKPREFYDLVVEVALIRPGPIQGGSVHPYLRRRNREPWQHEHPLLANALDRTLGVPLFQEQVMQMFSRFRLSHETSRTGCGYWSERHVERSGKAACLPTVRHHGWPAGIEEVTRSLVGLPLAAFGFGYIDLR